MASYQIDWKCVPTITYIKSNLSGLLNQIALDIKTLYGNFCLILDKTLLELYSNMYVPSTVQ